MADLTLIPGNPASRLRQQYENLMGIGCINELKEAALRIVEEGGVSDKNVQKFKAVLAKEKALPRLQAYITNYVLAASGNAVLGNSRR